MDDPFREGEVIYDSDGNLYTVQNGRAVLTVEGGTVSYFLGSMTRELMGFTRTPPENK